MPNCQSVFLIPFGLVIPSIMPASYARFPYEWTKLLMYYIREAKQYTSLADASANLSGWSECVRLESDVGLPFDVSFSPRCYVTNGLTEIGFTTFGELVHALQISIAQRSEKKVDVTVVPYRWMPVEGEISRSPAAIGVIEGCLERFPVDMSTKSVINCGYDDITGNRNSAPHQVRIDCKGTYLRVYFDGSSVKNTRSVVLEDGKQKFFSFTTEEELIAAIESATGMKPAAMVGAGGK